MYFANVFAFASATTNEAQVERNPAYIHPLQNRGPLYITDRNRIIFYNLLSNC
jgi:hypothetical protein